ncbi:MAG: EamA family transporter, partial [Planctomycetota bacterium]
MPYLGEITSLLAAMCWTVSSTAFAVASRAASPLAANQFRLYASLPLLLALAFALLGGPWPVGATGGQRAAAAASGLCGLVHGDIGDFYALAKIGPRLCSVIMVSWPAC